MRLKFVIILVSTCFVFLAFEVTLRLFWPQDIGSVINIYIEDSDLKYKHIPNATAQQVTGDYHVDYRTNSFGFRDKEYSIIKAANTCRILIIGDSMSVGHGVQENQMYSEVLERKLNENLKGKVAFDVLNSAVGGYQLYHYIQSMKKYAQTFSVDLVVVGFFIGNDFRYFNSDSRMVISDGYLMGYDIKTKETDGIKKKLTIGKKIRNYLEPVRIFLALNSHSYVFVRKSVYPLLLKLNLADARYSRNLDMYKVSTPAAVEKMYRDTAENIRILVQLAHEAHVKLVVLIIPSNYQVDDDIWKESLTASATKSEEVRYNVPNVRLISMLDNHKVPYIELLPLMRSAPTVNFYFPHDAHLAPAGHLFAANRIYDFLSRLVGDQVNHTGGGCPINFG